MISKTRIWPKLAVLLFVSGAVMRAATPTLIQHVSCSNTQGINVGTYTCPFPNSTLDSNAIVVGFQFADGQGVTNVAVSDNVGNSYTIISNSDGNQIANVAYAIGTTSGVASVTITFNGGSSVGRWVAATISEFNNITAIDGSDVNSDAGSTVTTGPITPTASGDLFYLYAINDNPGYCYSWSAGPGGTLLSSDWIDGQVAQYTIYNSSDPIVPTLSQSITPAIGMPFL